EVAALRAELLLQQQSLAGRLFEPRGDGATGPLLILAFGFQRLGIIENAPQAVTLPRFGAPHLHHAALALAFHLRTGRPELRAGNHTHGTTKACSPLILEARSPALGFAADDDVLQKLGGPCGSEQLGGF